MCAVSKPGWLQAGISLLQRQDIGSQRHTRKKNPKFGGVPAHHWDFDRLCLILQMPVRPRKLL